ncbi:MAG: hypothetical protein KME16_00610 [Scytolyngbya sp. HA4215-MV1]|jgi:hypothetical protein|nr:hypothetical protein [Scytolyngbya sp. HA4215-MV1]
MLTNHRMPITLSLVSTDLPIGCGIETVGTLYQKDTERFHLLLTEPHTKEWQLGEDEQFSLLPQPPRLLWLEISPYRVILTMQGDERFSYRHLWERGIYGLSRFWLQGEEEIGNSTLRLRNFTRELTLEGRSLPRALRIDYELWTANLQLGRYILNLEIQH